MQVQTLSVVIGKLGINPLACNAKCKGCVARMTAACGDKIDNNFEIDQMGLRKSLLLARLHNADTCLLTSKGETTLPRYQDMITFTIQKANEYGYPCIEIQTNGITLLNGEISDATIWRWKSFGLNTVCLSAVSIDHRENAEYFGNEEYPDVQCFVEKMKRFRLSVRLSIMTIKGYVDSYERIVSLIDFCKKHKIEQLTIRNLGVPSEDRCKDMKVYEFCKNNRLHPLRLWWIFRQIKANSKLLYNLMHGGQVRDMRGQNIALTTCLTLRPDTKQIRQLIYNLADGHLRYDWVYEGAIIF